MPFVIIGTQIEGGTFNNVSDSTTQVFDSHITHTGISSSLERGDDTHVLLGVNEGVIPFVFPARRFRITSFALAQKSSISQSSSGPDKMARSGYEGAVQAVPHLREAEALLAPRLEYPDEDKDVPMWRPVLALIVAQSVAWVGVAAFSFATSSSTQHHLAVDVRARYNTLHRRRGPTSISFISSVGSAISHVDTDAPLPGTSARQ
ncbi:hypothetical protein C8R44DRAFT_891730 [Mycena epipterygia]|nr:hypothetical protein C8R44DRAFT_891730 [Mycena epipterygia]